MILEYYNKVLGLRYLPRPRGYRIRLLVVDLPSVPEGLENNPLYPKMIAALGLKHEEVSLLELLPSEVESHPVIWERCPVLSFSPELSEVIKITKAINYLVTVCGPRDLVKNPALKKETWTGLQALIQELGRSSKSP